MARQTNSDAFDQEIAKFEKTLEKERKEKMKEFWKFVSVGVVGILICLTFLSTFVIQPGTRGVKVVLGKSSDECLNEGVHFFIPVITRVERIEIRQTTQFSECVVFSSDLQTIKMKIGVLYRIPDNKVKKTSC